MAKSKSVFFCQSCGAQYAKWKGQCSACHEWNTLVEEVQQKESANKVKLPDSVGANRVSKPIPIREISGKESDRIPVEDVELSRVLGGGIVPGSLVLVGGEPGIGKSTLMLQLAVAYKNLKVMYVSGEESAEQIKLRAERIAKELNPNCFILTETDTQNIFKQIEESRPDILIIDSIQTLYSAFLEAAPGTVSQIRQCAAELMKFAKATSVPVFIIGHINKDGAIAGPKVLEHMVDTVLQFEGDRHYNYRLLRAHKNRFGSTSEIGIYDMKAEGLLPVSNPGEVLLSNHEESLSGVAIGVSMEGQRPMLIEVQALVSPAVFGNPQRSATGFDLRRLNMLLAVLEKKCGYQLTNKDVFLNITGGFKIDDPAIDLAVCAAIISSQQDKAIEKDICFAAEVGLGGELRPVQKLDQRVAEALKLGYKQLIAAPGKESDRSKIKAGWKNLSEVIQKVF